MDKPILDEKAASPSASPDNEDLTQTENDCDAEDAEESKILDENGVAVGDSQVEIERRAAIAQVHMAEKPSPKLIEQCRAMTIADISNVDRKYVEKGMALFFNNQYVEAEEVFKEMQGKDPLVAASLAVLYSMRALLSMEQQYINQACAFLLYASHFAKDIIPPKKGLVSAALSGMTKWFKKPSAKELQPMSAAAFRSSVVMAEAEVLRGTVLLLEETFSSYIRAGLALRRAYNIYDALQKHLEAFQAQELKKGTLKKADVEAAMEEARRWNADDEAVHVGLSGVTNVRYAAQAEAEAKRKRQIEDEERELNGLPPLPPPPLDPKDIPAAKRRYGIDIDNNSYFAMHFGLGCIHITTSILPEKILKILSTLGYMHDRKKGFDHMQQCLNSGTIRAPLASLFLMAFHGMLPSFTPLMLKDSLPAAARVDRATKRLFPKSIIHLWVSGRVNRLAREDLRSSSTRKIATDEIVVGDDDENAVAGGGLVGEDHHRQICATTFAYDNDEEYGYGDGKALQQQYNDGNDDGDDNDNNDAASQRLKALRMSTLTTAASVRSAAQKSAKSAGGQSIAASTVKNTGVRTELGAATIQYTNDDVEIFQRCVAEGAQSSLAKALPQLKDIALYDLAWSLVSRLEWYKAAMCFKILEESSMWSKCFYAYAQGCCWEMLGYCPEAPISVTQESACGSPSKKFNLDDFFAASTKIPAAPVNGEQLASQCYWRAIGYKTVKLGGKEMSIDQFVFKRVKRMIAVGKSIHENLVSDAYLFYEPNAANNSEKNRQLYGGEYLLKNTTMGACGLELAMIFSMLTQMRHENLLSARVVVEKVLQSKMLSGIEFKLNAKELNKNTKKAEKLSRKKKSGKNSGPVTYAKGAVVDDEDVVDEDEYNTNTNIDAENVNEDDLDSLDNSSDDDDKSNKRASAAGNHNDDPSLAVSSDEDEDSSDDDDDDEGRYVEGTVEDFADEHDEHSHMNRCEAQHTTTNALSSSSSCPSAAAASDAATIDQLSPHSFADDAASVIVSESTHPPSAHTSLATTTAENFNNSNGKKQQISVRGRTAPYVLLGSAPEYKRLFRKHNHGIKEDMAAVMLLYANICREIIRTAELSAEQIEAARNAATSASSAPSAKRSIALQQPLPQPSFSYDDVLALYQRISEVPQKDKKKSRKEKKKDKKKTAEEAAIAAYVSSHIMSNVRSLHPLTGLLELPAMGLNKMAAFNYESWVLAHATYEIGILYFYQNKMKECKHCLQHDLKHVVGGKDYSFEMVMQFRLHLGNSSGVLKGV